uniref:Target of Myb protein 1 n=1 Tax=Kalanchoe fedtschenkoi TaxID=63787 RepID=A0A7N0UG19_KALFE
MASELVNSATSDKLPEPDWMANIHVCESVARDPRLAKDVIKAIKKRLASKNATVQLYTIMLLEMLMNNIGENVHRQVIDTDLLPLLVKIVKKKSESPVREKVFLLLDATQTSVGGASGKFPQYYNAYCDVVSSGVQFPRSTGHVSVNVTALKTDTRTAQGEDVARSKPEEDAHNATPQSIPDLSVIQKASATLQVLREVLDAIDTQHPEGAKDEFTLDLVEQCSYQKQRVMQLIMTCRDEKVVSEAIPLNEQLEKVLSRHDMLISGRIINPPCESNNDEAQKKGAVDDEEEEEEQLLQRSRKGKARMQPEVEEAIGETNGLMKSLTIAENLAHRPHTRTLSSSDHPVHRPHTRTLSSSDPPVQAALPFAGVVIPPPPAKHVERERFFQENRVDTSHSSLHSRNASGSGSAYSYTD